MAASYPFDPAVAAAFLARVAAGEVTAAVLDTPGAPCQRAYACAAAWKKAPLSGVIGA